MSQACWRRLWLESVPNPTAGRHAATTTEKAAGQRDRKDCIHKVVTQGGDTNYQSLDGRICCLSWNASMF